MTAVEALNLWHTYILKFYLKIQVDILVDRANRTGFQVLSPSPQDICLSSQHYPHRNKHCLGPQGWKIVWYQPADDNRTTSVPALASEPFPESPLSTPVCVPSRSFGTDIIQDLISIPALSPILPNKMAMLLPSSSGKCAPKASGVLREAINKAHAYIKKVPQKRTLLDTLLEMQEYVPFSTAYLLLL